MTPPLRRPRSEAELRRASDQFYYDYWMFAKLANGLALGIIGDGVLHNAVLESFTVHGAAVLGFLYDDRPDPDEPSAIDYVASAAEWIDARPKPSLVLQQVHRDMSHRAANEIGRVSYQAEDPPERKPWPFMQIAKEVDRAVGALLAVAPEHYLGPRWQNVKRQREGKAEAS